MSKPTWRADALGAFLPLRQWVDARVNEAAEVLAASTERLWPRRRVVFVEQEDGALKGPDGDCRIEDGRCVFADGGLKLRGAEVEFRLRPERCMFRELELPAGAGQFLDGVVRAQLDRLTPWRPAEAAFGWSSAPAVTPDRLRITVAATRRQPLAALIEVGAESVVVTTSRPGETAAIEILSRRSGALARRARWRAAVAAALAISVVCALAALVAETTLGAQWRQEAETQTSLLAQRRAVLVRRERADDDPTAQALDARKRATPAAVVALEALSQAIPDEAYLTQLRLSGDKLEIAGVAADAAALIGHIEQSPHFSRAKFSAPTTRDADERETFRIEAHVAPLNTSPP